MRISLVGLPGGGKTTVGRHLAHRLAKGFVDSDAVIEAQLREPIRSFFEREGEAAFREIERRVIDELSAQGDVVLATGGGAVLLEANRAALRERTTVVYLRAAPEELVRRLRRDTKRPLLQGGDPLRKLRDLHAVRDPLYREVAHFTVEINRPSVAVLVNMIAMQLELGGVLDAERPADAAHDGPSR